MLISINITLKYFYEIFKILCALSLVDKCVWMRMCLHNVVFKSCVLLRNILESHESIFLPSQSLLLTLEGLGEFSKNFAILQQRVGVSLLSVWLSTSFKFSFRFVNTVKIILMLNYKQSLLPW